MNIPKQKEKKSFVMKLFLAELILTLSIIWTGFWIIEETKFFPVILAAGLLITHFLNVSKMPIKVLYGLCASAILIAILVTLLV